MGRTTYSGKPELVAAIDHANAAQGRAQRDMLVAIADGDKAGIWIADGCVDMGLRAEGTPLRGRGPRSLRSLRRRPSGGPFPPRD